MKTLPVMLISATLGGAVGVALAYSRSAASADLSVALAGVAGPELDTSVARIEVEEPEHNFGAMQRGATRNHDFVVKNVGQKPLTLTAGDTSCKCTSFVAPSGSVAPGDAARVKLEWVAKSLPGEFRQTANLHTNDPLRPIVQLSVSGEVVEPAGLEPDSFMLGEVRTGEPTTASVLFFTTEEEELRVEAFAPNGESISGLFSVEVTDVAKDDLPNANATSGKRITLTAKAGLPVGQVMEWVELRTNQLDAEKLEVPVHGRVTGDITVHGSGWSEENGVLHLGMVPQATGAKRRLILSAKGEQAAETRFQIASVEPPELKATIGKTVRKDDDVYHTILTVEVPPDTRPMIHLNNAQGEDGILRLKTTHPVATEMNLRVRFAVVQ